MLSPERLQEIKSDTTKLIAGYPWSGLERTVAFEVLDLLDEINQLKGIIRARAGKKHLESMGVNE
jgi:hypothetical protein